MNERADQNVLVSPRYVGRSGAALGNHILLCGERDWKIGLSKHHGCVCVLCGCWTSMCHLQNTVPYTSVDTCAPVCADVSMGPDASGWAPCSRRTVTLWAVGSCNKSSEGEPKTEGDVLVMQNGHQ